MMTKEEHMEIAGELLALAAALPHDGEIAPGNAVHIYGLHASLLREAWDHRTLAALPDEERARILALREEEEVQS